MNIAGVTAVTAGSPRNSICMLLQRFAVIAVLLPVWLGAVFFGGWVYLAVVMVMMGIAAWEYVGLFRTGGLRPASFLVVGGTLALVAGRWYNGFQSAPLLVSVLVLLSMGVHLFEYERGREQAATDFGITLGGIFYIGWLGSYFISLRNEPQGQWWVTFVLLCIWATDGTAYSVGRRWGRRKLAPRLSPNKSWEGYLGGVLAATASGALMVLVGESLLPGGPVAVWRGAVVGFTLAALSLLGDLGESMIKRQVGVKDAGKILLSHGGFFDRIDSWLWGIVLGYYLITLFLY